MAVLKHQSELIATRSLAVRSLVGRAPGCLLRLEDPGVSAEHASIFWTGERWEIRDLGSRNGTFVAGQKLEAGKRIALLEGAEIVFGNSTQTWIFADARPPTANARHAETSETRLAEEGILVLPSDADPAISIFEDESGHWMIEDAGRVRRARDQEMLDAGGSWTLSVPPPAPKGSVATTRQLVKEPTYVAALTLEFVVSPDEEHIELAVAHEDRRTLLAPRVHHYLLLTLVRARIAAERDNRSDPSEQGWLLVDDVLEMLKIDAQHLSVYVFRARQQLAAAGVLNPGSIIERRPVTRQIRFGAARVAMRTLSPSL